MYTFDSVVPPDQTKPPGSLLWRKTSSIRVLSLFPSLEIIHKNSYWLLNGHLGDLAISGTILLYHGTRAITFGHGIKERQCSPNLHRMCPKEQQGFWSLKNTVWEPRPNFIWKILNVFGSWCPKIMKSMHLPLIIIKCGVTESAHQGSPPQTTLRVCFSLICINIQRLLWESTVKTIITDEPVSTLGFLDKYRKIEIKINSLL